MQEEEEVRYIIGELQSLHIRENDLLTRLALLTVGEANKKEDKKTKGSVPRNTNREFAIGDAVRIKNPGPFQAASGSIIRIGKERITVRASNGSKIIRASKNLIHEQ